MNSRILAKFAIVAFTLIIALNSCKKEVEFDERILESKLVVNGFVCADSIIKVQLAVSKPIPGIKKNMEWINDATVKLYVDGDFKEELQNVKIEYNDEHYYYWAPERPDSEFQSLTTIAQAGKKYKIEIECDDFEIAWAETTIPDKVLIDTVRTDIKEVTEYGYTETRKFLYMKFSDPINEKNYYRLTSNNARGRRSTFWNDETSQYEVIDSVKQVFVSYNFDNTIYSEDPLLNGNEDADDYLLMEADNEYNLFNDDLINGQDYELSFNEYYNYGSEGPEIEGDFEYTNITLMTLSREAYLYIKSSYEHWLYDEDFLTEPVQVYTNINNGIGIFAGYSFDEYSIGKGEYPIDSFEYIYSNYY